MKYQVKIENLKIHNQIYMEIKINKNNTIQKKIILLIKEEMKRTILREDK